MKVNNNSNVATCYLKLMCLRTLDELGMKQAFVTMQASHLRRHAVYRGMASDTHVTTTLSAMPHIRLAASCLIHCNHPRCQTVGFYPCVLSIAEDIIMLCEAFALLDRLKPHNLSLRPLCSPS
jgi:hypothetical protein